MQIKNSSEQDSDSIQEIQSKEHQQRSRIRTKSSSFEQGTIREGDQFKIRRSERLNKQSKKGRRNRDQDIEILRQEESKDHFLEFEVPKKIMLLEEAMLLQGLRNSLQTEHQGDQLMLGQARLTSNNDLNIDHTLRAGGGQHEYEKLQKIIGKYFGMADIQIIVKSPRWGIIEQFSINANRLCLTEEQKPKMNQLFVIIQSQVENGINRELKLLLLFDYIKTIGIVEQASEDKIIISTDNDVCTIVVEGEKQQQVMKYHSLIQNFCQFVIVQYKFNNQQDLQMAMQFISMIKQIKGDFREIIYINSFNQIKVNKVNDVLRIRYFMENNYIYGFIQNRKNISIKTLQEMFHRVMDKLTNELKTQDQENLIEEESSEVSEIEEYLVLEDTQVQCWNLYLSKVYENEEIQVIKDQDRLILTFDGEYQHNLKLKHQIEIQLKKLRYSNFRFFVPDINPKLLKILNDYPIDKIFQSDIHRIQQAAQVHYLQLQEINSIDIFISFEAVHEQQEQLLGQALKKLFIKSLEFHIVDIDLNSLFDYTKLSKQQFEIEYNCYMQVIDQQSYVTLAHHNDKIKQIIQEYIIGMENFSTLKLAIPQKLLQNSIKDALNTGLIDKSISMYIENDSFILKGRDNLLRQAELIIYEYKQQLLNQFEFRSFNLTLKEWEFIQKYHLKDLQEIEESLQCIIVFQDNQQIQDDRKFAQQILMELEQPQLQSTLEFKLEYVDISIGCKDTITSQDIEENIQTLIKNNTVEIVWQVINLQQEDLKQVKEFIEKNSIVAKGVLKFGNQIQIQCTKKKAQKINDYFATLKKDKVIYPQNWIAQQDNFISVELQSNSQEFKEILNLFNQTYPNGIIYQVNRLQNMALYNNFHLEKAKLIQLRQQNGIVADDIMLDKQLWHGVKGVHPMVVYNGQKEAFDHTYSSNNSLWGPGIYFSSSAVYSKKYSYTLQMKESVKYYGKKVMLLCLVCRGKVAYMKQDNNIRRPPENFDCVGGYTENTEITVLYGMDVRRAYPQYEIIFE